MTVPVEGKALSGVVVGCVDSAIVDEPRTNATQGVSVLANQFADLAFPWEPLQVCMCVPAFACRRLWLCFDHVMAKCLVPSVHLHMAPLCFFLQVLYEDEDNPTRVNPWEPEPASGGSSSSASLRLRTVDPASTM